MTQLKNEPTTNDLRVIDDPLKLISLVWPDVRLYDKQKEIIESVWHNDQTFVPAGNDLGKDFIAGLAALCFFLSREPVRVLTTSVDTYQLEGVLWGEIRNFISNARFTKEELGIETLYKSIYQVGDGGTDREAKSVLLARVAKKGEGLLGWHLPIGKDGRPKTLLVMDEASGLEDVHFDKVDTWAHRILVIGNPFPCDNFFKKGVIEGDIPDPHEPGRFHRKIIHIRGQDSPNVKRGFYLTENYKLNYKQLRQESLLIPGVLTYDLYEQRRRLWDDVKQKIGLDGEFYEGKSVLLYPPQMLDESARRAETLPKNRQAETMGVDPAEGGDSSVWTIIDNDGIIEQISMKTPDTADIPNETIRLIHKYNLPPEKVLFDRGGGGKQHADTLRRKGFSVRTVAFGEAASPEQRKRFRMGARAQTRKIEDEARYVYKNRRAEMYGLLRFELLEPDEGVPIFAIPKECNELRRQLAPIPLQYDGEGRLYLPPKNKRSSQSNEVTLTELLKCSPDEADSLVLAVFGLFNVPQKKKLGAL